MGLGQGQVQGRTDHLASGKWYNCWGRKLNWLSEWLNSTQLSSAQLKIKRGKIRNGSERDAKLPRMLRMPPKCCTLDCVDWWEQRAGIRIRIRFGSASGSGSGIRMRWVGMRLVYTVCQSTRPPYCQQPFQHFPSSIQLPTPNSHRPVFPPLSLWASITTRLGFLSSPLLSPLICHRCHFLFGASRR